MLRGDGPVKTQRLAGSGVDEFERTDAERGGDLLERGPCRGGECVFVLQRVAPIALRAEGEFVTGARRCVFHHG